MITPRKPLTPLKPFTALEFPDYVIASFNKLLTDRRYHQPHGGIHIPQNDVVEEIIATAKQYGVVLSRHDVFDRKLLDVEGVYSEVGWIVTYHKQYYFNETTSYFLFQQPEKV